MITIPDQAKATVWVLCSHKAGELAQQRALAQALGYPFYIKSLSHKTIRLPVDLLRRISLHGLDTESRERLKPPWPQLLISAGVRTESIARWIKQQSQGYSKIIHLGRNWANYPFFDLIITTPQYRLPVRNNILHNQMTMHAISSNSLQQARTQWQTNHRIEPVAHIAVLIGGHSGPFTFGIRAAKRLAGHLNRLAKNRGAKLLISTSARTPVDSQLALRQALTADNEFFSWSRNQSQNPYLAYIAIAKEIVVTGDSIAMLSEAIASGKPVYIFDPGVGKKSMRRTRPTDSGENDFRLSGSLYQMMMHCAPTRLSRDIRLAHDYLINNHYATWLEAPYHISQQQAPDELHSTVERIQQLLGKTPLPTR